MAIAQNFPTISPSLLLDFANVEALDPRITFARATTATYYGTRTALAEQNLLVQSQLFATTWILSNLAATENATTAPDSTVTAASIIPSATSATHIQAKNISSATGVFTYSLYAKANGYNYLQLFWNSGSDYANFFLSGGGSVSQSSGAAAVITSVGSGWYRCSITSTVSAYTQVYFGAMVTGTEARAASYLGDGTSGIFVWGAQLEQRSSVTAYTPTTTQPITNYVPVLETAASGVARFDHNPTTFESLGLLIEEQRTNIQPYSEDFTNAAWRKFSITVTPNANIAPNGTLTASLWTGTGSGVSQVDNFPTNYGVGGTEAFTFYAKANTASSIRLAETVGATTVNFNLSTGVATVVGTAATAIMQSVGNGWYRCGWVLNKPGIYAYTQIGIGSGYIPSPTTGSVFIWGAQLEIASFSTSYIPTVASQVTRAADAASMTGTNFTSWFNNAEFSLYQDIQFQTGSPVRFGDAFANNIETIRNNTFSAGVYGALANTAFPTQLYTTAGSPSYPAGTFVANQRQVAAFAMSLNSFASGYSGVGATATPTYNPAAATFSGLFFGGTNLGANFSGRIRKIAYYPKALTATQLQALTS